MMARSLGLIGVGAIGGMILQACAERRVEYRRIAVLLRRPRTDIEERLREIEATVVSDIDDLIRERPDVIVEAAGHDAVRAYGVGIARAGIDFILMSVGALADDTVRATLKAAARVGNVTVSMPSGAVGGLDALTAARALGDLEYVIHRIIKRPEAFRRVTYVIEQGLLAGELTEPLVIYRGAARDAARYFPQSANVAAAVSLAGLGFDRTEVEVIADPTTQRTIHEIQAHGRFGDFILRFENAVDPSTPRTTRLAGLSAIAALQEHPCVLRLI